MTEFANIHQPMDRAEWLRRNLNDTSCASCVHFHRENPSDTSAICQVVGGTAYDWFVGCPQHESRKENNPSAL